MATAIMNHHMTAAQALSGGTATPMTAASGNSSSTNGAASDSATISANDFLTLLVTEMKNQDPTAATDPNQYINQLVNVNSLQQLISINQTLTNDSKSSTDTSTATGGTQRGGAKAQVQAASSGATATVSGITSTAAAKVSPGNLSVPTSNPAAQSIAQSLGGRPRLQ